MDASVSSVNVITTNDRGMTPEELTKLCVQRIVGVSSSAPEVIRDQAYAYQRLVEHVILAYMKEAVRNDRATVYTTLEQAGLHDVVELLRST